MESLAIMVAPTGARKGKADHPNIPLTEQEIIAEASICVAMGAQAIHLHVRDQKGRHSLDPVLYSSAIAALRESAGRDFVIQITTESIGQFTPEDQIQTIRSVEPEAVSIAVKELVPDATLEPAAADFYAWAFRRKIGVQHIIYDLSEFDLLLALISRGTVPGNRHSVIFPLGRYVKGQESDPIELVPFISKVNENGGQERFDWFACAFGALETQALVVAAGLHGHCRIGFENSFINADGSRASSNAERLADFNKAICGNYRKRASREETLRLLGRPS